MTKSSDLYNYITTIENPNEVVVMEIEKIMFDYMAQYKMAYNKLEQQAIEATGFHDKEFGYSKIYFGYHEIRLYEKDEVDPIDSYVEAKVVTKFTQNLYARVVKKMLAMASSNVIYRIIADNTVTAPAKQIKQFVHEAVDNHVAALYEYITLRDELYSAFNTEYSVTDYISFDTHYYSIEVLVKHAPDFDLTELLTASPNRVFEIQYPNERKISYNNHYMKFQDALINAEPDEYDLTEEGLAKPAYTPISVAFQITDACNLRCTYCYQKDHGKTYMTKETARKAIEYLLVSGLTNNDNDYFNVKHSPAITLELVGGDGLMNIELIDYIMTYFYQRMIDMNHPWLHRFGAFISTNGVLYRNKRVQEVCDKWEDALGVCVSVDGNEELHNTCRIFPDGSGSYKYANDCFQDLLKKGKGPMSKMTLSPDNLDYLVPSIIDFIEKGHIHIWFNCIQEHEWTDEEAHNYFVYLCKIIDYVAEHNLLTRINIGVFGEGRFVAKEPGKDENNYCGGDGHMIEVGPTGKIYNCSRYMEMSIGPDREPLIIGDIYRGIGATESDRKHIKIMRSTTRRSQSTDECYYCPVAHNCYYCIAYSYELYGTVDKRVTTTCKMHKANALANIYYLSKMHDADPIVRKEKIPLPYESVSSFISQQEYNTLKKYEKED